MDFRLPPHILNAHHQTRQVGFELEFTGLDLDQIVEILVSLFEGEIVKDNQFLYHLKQSCYGDFGIEIDTSILTHKTYDKYLQKFGIDLSQLGIRRSVEQLLENVAAILIPYEITTPPFPINDLTAVETLRAHLQAAKALGSKMSPIYAFGLHINPEVPSYETAVLVNYLRAFFLLYDWICMHTKIDFSRRIAPFIRDFSEDYIELVLDKNYQPRQSQFIDDYLFYNPSRNRPLDLLPLFLHLDKNQIPTDILQNRLIKSRPTFHYRLPNCLIDDPDWHIAQEWYYWVEIEKLAYDEEKLVAMSERYLAIQHSKLAKLKRTWHKEVEDFMA